MGIIDSHCHLSYYDSSELDELRNNCIENGIIGMLNVSTCLDDLSSVVNTTNVMGRNTWCSIGEHPCNIKKSPVTEKDIIDLYNDNRAGDKIIAIGETGLDLVSDNFIDEQILSFSAHISASLYLDIPIIVHSRNAEIETIEVIKNANQDVRGVLHCFSGSKDFMRSLLDLGFYISISGIVTFKNAQNLRDAIKYLPLDRILVETDSPYLAPTPKRGQRNQPCFVKYTTQCIADILSKSLEDISNQTTKNFQNLFKIQIL